MALPPITVLQNRWLKVYHLSFALHERTRRRTYSMQSVAFRASKGGSCQMLTMRQHQYFLNFDSLCSMFFLKRIKKNKRIVWYHRNMKIKLVFPIHYSSNNMRTYKFIISKFTHNTGSMAKRRKKSLQGMRVSYGSFVVELLSRMHWRTSSEKHWYIKEANAKKPTTRRAKKSEASRSTLNGAEIEYHAF